MLVEQLFLSLVEVFQARLSGHLATRSLFTYDR